MKRMLPMVLLFAALPFQSGAEEDLLRFTNGDQLHGKFLGIGEGPFLRWRRDDVREPVEWKTSQVRQVVLRGGRPARGLPSLSHVALVNGDRLPGVITGLDEESVTLDTSYAGILRLPRPAVGMLAPSPLGGRVLYQGPFAGEEWDLVDASGKAEVGEGEEAPWKFGGTAWFWQKGKTAAALARKEGMPDRSILRFNVAWKNRLSVCLGFHADFTRPEEVDEAPVVRNRGGDASVFPWIFGNAYVLQISNYVMLYRVGFDADGVPSVEPVRSVNSNIRLGESGEVTVELRCNRRSGELSLFVDDEFVSQWSEMPDGRAYAGKGDGYGFLVQSDHSSVRVSEMILAEWNGMPDSARSLQTEDQDIVLLANGTDRFSGKVASLSEGKLHLEGRYGDFRFPLDDVAEVRFAKNALSGAGESSGDHVMVRMRPLGRISGRPLDGTDETLKLVHPQAGEVEVELSGAVILDFNSSSSFIDEWDEQF